ncbi:MAG: hypothetical protein HY606_15035 [Planctomycetes bacterium]|nr:hypothetical protein [Planctomycetota bacterium]
MVRWIILAASFLVAGYMLLDGIVALVTGMYITPKTGEYAGKLGPWSRLVSYFGIDPLSPFMKSWFALYGFLWIILCVLFVLKIPWSSKGMIIAAVGALWYLPFGTILSVLVILLSLFVRS